MTHHAYVYEGSLSLLSELVADARERFNFNDEQHPDVHVREFSKFGIDESRWLSSAAAFKPSTGRALFVVGIGSITTEAQQALLKLLEEPQSGVVFVLLLPHGVLLPTVRSRTAHYPSDFSGKAPALAGAKKFLHASGKERSDTVVALLKDEEGARERARDFVDALEAELYKQVGDPQARVGLVDIAMVRDYLRDRSPSLKMLLEHLAIALPTL